MEQRDQMILNAGIQLQAIADVNHSFCTHSANTNISHLQLVLIIPVFSYCIFVLPQRSKLIYGSCMNYMVTSAKAIQWLFGLQVGSTIWIRLQDHHCSNTRPPNQLTPIMSIGTLNWLMLIVSFLLVTCIVDEQILDMPRWPVCNNCINVSQIPYPIPLYI